MLEEVRRDGGGTKVDAKANPGDSSAEKLSQFYDARQEEHRTFFANFFKRNSPNFPGIDSSHDPKLMDVLTLLRSHQGAELKKHLNHI